VLVYIPAIIHYVDNKSSLRTGRQHDARQLVFVSAMNKSDAIPASSDPRIVPGASARPSSDQAGPAAGRRRLLVVDDDQSVRDLVKIMGNHLGYVVHESINGAEALRLLQEKAGAIDVVLVDAYMPVMGGLQFVAALRKASTPPAVVVMSGIFDPSLRAAFLSEGVAVLLFKPFITGELSRALSDALKTAR
jgi:CheY-like chemotaxis protein